MRSNRFLFRASSKPTSSSFTKARADLSTKRFGSGSGFPKVACFGSARAQEWANQSPWPTSATNLDTTSRRCTFVNITAKRLVQ